MSSKRRRNRQRRNNRARRFNKLFEDWLDTWAANELAYYALPIEDSMCPLLSAVEQESFTRLVRFFPDERQCLNYVLYEGGS